MSRQILMLKIQALSVSSHYKESQPENLLVSKETQWCQRSCKLSY